MLEPQQPPDPRDLEARHGARLARILRILPAQRLADIAYLHNGMVVPGVPILCQSASTNSGGQNLPELTPLSDSLGLATPTERAAIGIVLNCTGHPVIVGFLTPPESQVKFEAEDFTVHRLPNDFYMVSDGDGNTELFHPSGTYLRIGENAEHEDLTGKDFNRRWAIKRNTEKRVSMRLRVVADGETQADITLTPDGDIVATGKRDITATAERHIAVSAGGNITALATGNLTAIADGDVLVQAGGRLAAMATGPADVQSGAAITLTAPTVTINAPTCVMTGNLAVTGNIIGKTVTEVTTGVGLGTHRHIGVQPGTGTTGRAQG